MSFRTPSPVHAWCVNERTRAPRARSAREHDRAQCVPKWWPVPTFIQIRALSPPPLVELAGGMAGHLLAWERHERDGSWWAWVSWVHETGGRRDHKVVLVRADSLRPLEPPEAYKAVPRRVRGLDGQIRSR